MTAESISSSSAHEQKGSESRGALPAHPGTPELRGTAAGSDCAEVTPLRAHRTLHLPRAPITPPRGSQTSRTRSAFIQSRVWHSSCTPLCCHLFVLVELQAQVRSPLTPKLSASSCDYWELLPHSTAQGKPQDFTLCHRHPYSFLQCNQKDAMTFLKTTQRFLSSATSIIIRLQTNSFP